MDKIKFLNRYHNLKIRIQKKKEYIDFCEERSNLIPGPVYEEKIGSNPNRNTDAPFTVWILKKIDAERELAELEESIKKVKIEIESAIARLDNVDYQKILTYRYIDGLTWREISESMYLSKSSVYRWHDDAVEKLEI